VGSIVATAAHFVDTSTTMFTAMKHLASAYGIVAVASEIGGATFASASVVSSSMVA
jgi:hypothetical protein